MAGVGVDSSSTDCPVCSEEFTDPKLLACNHLVCRKCVLAWLTKAGRHGGCPLCRAPILPSPRSSAWLPPSGPEELERLVEALPTDLSMVAKVESQKVLSSGHVCMYCDNHVPATSFCLQCNMKLCATCSKGHKKIPALKNHVIEDLNQLTPQRLVEINRCTCKNHDDRLAELYCSTHQSLICLLCSSTNHRGCEEVKAIKEAAQAKKEELQTQAQRLIDLEQKMKTEITGVTYAFKAMRKKVKDVFDDLEHDLARRRQKMYALIQVEEDKVDVGGMDQQRAALASHVTVINNLLTSAPDDALLDMATKMKQRFFDLDWQTTRRSSVKVTSDVVFDEMTLARLKSAIDILGTLVTTSTGTSKAVPFTGVETAMAMGPAAGASVVTASHTSVTTPQKTSDATPKKTSVVIPKKTSEATPKQTSEATHKQMSAATPKNTSMATPKHTSAATPKHTSAATPQQKSVVTPQQKSAKSSWLSYMMSLGTAVAKTASNTSKPTGADLVKVLKVGDRVKPGHYWYPLCDEEKSVRHGTVIAFPSVKASGPNRRQCADVRWDNGYENYYHMGLGNQYELDLL